MKKTWIVLALAAAGCAGASQGTKRSEDSLVGHWMGAIDRGGLQGPLSLDIESGGGGYAGSWMSISTQPGVMLDSVQRDGDEVRFDLRTLRFDGRISGRTLTGLVTDRADGKPVGGFSLTRVDPLVAIVP